MMKKLVASFFILMCYATAFCAPFPQRPLPMHRTPSPQQHCRCPQPAPPPHDQRWICPMLIGGIVSYISTPIPQPRPIVVAVQPPVQLIWIDGHFERRAQSNGTITTVWVPGKYVEVPLK